jgi:2OG-Fe(II) oxygenase superfamily
MLQVGISRIVVPDEAEIAEWHRAFASSHCIRVPRFFDERLLAWLRAQLATALFHPRIHEGIEPPPVDLGLADDRLLAIIATLLNDKRVFDVVRAISGCAPIGCFTPVVYRMEPRPEHFDTWHGDTDGNRMVTLSVNLGDPYDGGVLQIREKPSNRVVHEVANTGPGDAILFDLGDHLEHCVSRVTGQASKMALAGWFQRTPSALNAFKRSRER